MVLTLPFAFMPLHLRAQRLHLLPPPDADEAAAAIAAHSAHTCTPSTCATVAPMLLPRRMCACIRLAPTAGDATSSFCTTSDAASAAAGAGGGGAAAPPPPSPTPRTYSAGTLFSDRPSSYTKSYTRPLAPDSTFTTTAVM